MPGVHLKMILGSIENIACSALNLKVLLEPGQREVCKMLQLLEFVTGIDEDEARSVRLAVRNTKTWSCLIAARQVDAAGVTCPSNVIYLHCGWTACTH